MPMAQLAIRPRNRRNNQRRQFQTLRQNMAQQPSKTFPMSKTNGVSNAQPNVAKVEEWGSVRPGLNTFAFRPRISLPSLPFLDYTAKAYDSYTLVAAILNFRSAAPTTEAGLLTMGLDYNGKTPIKSEQDIKGLANYRSGRVYQDHTMTVAPRQAMKGRTMLSCYTENSQDPYDTDAFSLYIFNPSNTVVGNLDITWTVKFHSPNLASAESSSTTQVVFQDRVDDGAPEANAIDSGSVDPEEEAEAFPWTGDEDISFDRAENGYVRNFEKDHMESGQSAVFSTIPAKEVTFDQNGMAVMVPRRAAAQKVRVYYKTGEAVPSDHYSLTPIVPSDRTLIVGTAGQPKIIADILATVFSVVKAITKPFVVGIVNSIYGDTAIDKIPIDNLLAVQEKYGGIPPTITGDLEGYMFAELAADDTTLLQAHPIFSK